MRTILELQCDLMQDSKLSYEEWVEKYAEDIRNLFEANYDAIPDEALATCIRIREWMRNNIVSLEDTRRLQMELWDIMYRAIIKRFSNLRKD